VSRSLEDRARRTLARAASRPVLVVGDVMLDVFVWGRVARISPEAPVPVVAIERESWHLGGAANVAANLRALGGAPRLVGVVGQDQAAFRLRDELEAAGIEASLAASSPDRPTTVKTRIVAHHQQVVRADLERSDELAGELEADLLRRALAALAGAAAVVVSDYQKGVVTPRLMRRLIAQARRQRIPVLVDPKLRHFRLYRGASVVTPNLPEAEQATGLRLRGDLDVARAGRRLLEELRCAAVLVTRGEHGMSLLRAGRRPLHVPTAAREVYDVTGAGDTVVGTLALAVAAGAPLDDAARLANLAAGVVVGKLGTATADPEELIEAARRAARG
jgi:D-beta-D-heptose 7-phosphate kinase/D-beta-D-heptose 1-phosphate adenosyltransferase